MRTDDTIVALSSAVGAGARSIVRLSGPRAFDLLASLGASDLVHARATSLKLNFPAASRLAPTTVLSEAKVPIDTDVEPTNRASDDPLVIPATVYPFRAPRSFTGDDLIELHLPGSSWLARRALDALLALGARQADPGEYTSRAYLAGKLDLTAAEGVAATIAAASRRELDAARQLLAGELARRLRPIMDRLSETMALVEVGIDFVEEEVTFLPRADLLARIDELTSSLRHLLDASARFDRLSHEPRIVLLGRPNAGKSTLLNALAGHARAVVSDVAGTTRDALIARVTLRSGVATLVDVAGVDDDEPSLSRPDGAEASSSIESQMRSAAIREVERADLLIFVRAADDDRPPLASSRAPDLVVVTKRDLAATSHANAHVAISVSALSGEGLDELRDRLDALAFGPAASPTASLALTARHVACVARSCDALARVRDAVGQGDEVVAHQLRAALDDLGAILGVVSPDDVLGQVFSRFCIGK